ncbi:hypothetical protein [Tolumonas osonensis]|uniref:Uncharacterized protein n=1 Tax=Tolumonas osonensis TaxID=675874 RepID=A0A841GCE8_9GAMM|nr:hypothetical protein [Tolumonas osonensis]MBB6055629.1 hypothetical protein [Tolumonas osonensis]
MLQAVTPTGAAWYIRPRGRNGVGFMSSPHHLREQRSMAVDGAIPWG